MNNLLNVAIVLVAVGGGPTEDALKRERELLQGKWSVESQYSRGTRERQEWMNKANMTVEFRDDRVIFTSFGRKEEYTVKLDCSKSPKAMTLTLVAVDGKPESDDSPDIWVYDLGGEAVRLAFPYDRKTPIKQIDPESSNQIVITARRAK